MNHDRYDVVYAGAVLDGHDPARVRQALARLFRTDEKGIGHLFSGRPVVIRRDVDRATALKYQAAMQRAGALCRVRTARSASEAASSGPSRTVHQGGLASATIAPPGTVLVEPPRTAAAHFELDGLSLAEAGADILEDAAGGAGRDVRDIPDAAGLALAPPGTDVLDPTEIKPPPPPPDPGPFTLAPPHTGVADDD